MSNRKNIPTEAATSRVRPGEAEEVVQECAQDSDFRSAQEQREPIGKVCEVPSVAMEVRELAE
jgi:hypothetical protein